MNRLVKLCLVPAFMLVAFASTQSADAGYGHGHHYGHRPHYVRHYAPKVFVPVYVPKVIVVPQYGHCHGGFCY
jgi:hypothetical protein